MMFTEEESEFLLRYRDRTKLKQYQKNRYWYYVMKICSRDKSMQQIKDCYKWKLSGE